MRFTWKLCLRALVLVNATVESYFLEKDTPCTTEDGESGICTTEDKCGGIRGSSIRRRSRRNSSCHSPKFTCCPYKGGRRRSSVQKMVYKSMSPNERCSAASGSQPPAPSSGCCGREVDAVNRIVGGTATDLEQFPWMALFEYRTEQGIRTPHLCGGSLISSQYVLTAKHCITEPEKDHVRPTAVLLAEYDLRSESDCVETSGGGVDCITKTSIPVKSVTIHPDRDIALIKLETAARYNDFIRPICLPTSDVTASPAEDLEFFVAGWGLTESAPPRPSPIKLQTRVPFVPNETCEAIYKDSWRMHPSERPICAGGKRGRDSCNGDSGGPLMHRAVGDDYTEISGVISFGPSHCGGGGYPAVHVNVYDNRRWIVANMV